MKEKIQKKNWGIWWKIEPTIIGCQKVVAGGPLLKGGPMIVSRAHWQYYSKSESYSDTRTTHLSLSMNLRKTSEWSSWGVSDDHRSIIRTRNFGCTVHKEYSTVHLLVTLFFPKNFPQNLACTQYYSFLSTFSFSFISEQWVKASHSAK